MYQGRKVICTYSEKRARKDRHEREKRLIKAQYFMDNPSQLKKKASYHYLNKTGKDSYQLNEKKIKQDQMYDGFLAQYQLECCANIRSIPSLVFNRTRL